MSSNVAAVSCRDTSGAGILMMMLAMALVPMIDVQAKHLVVGGIPAMQVIFLRMMCGTILLLPVMVAGRREEIIPPDGRINAVLLGLFSIGAGFCFFGALEHLSIADTVAISFVQPLFVTLLSRLFLKETVGPARWIALLFGFGATLVIIRPSHGALEPGSLLALASGAAMAGYVILVKKATRGSRRLSPLTLTFQTHFMAVLVGAPPMVLLWVGLTPAQWWMVLGMTLFGLVGQYLIIKAYESADASLVAPFAYLEIVTSTAASWLFFSQVPDHITFIGVAMLVCSSVFIAWRR
ncbi:MAG: DMT family transporter [Albidovulum sp.]|uniref:DMT family transporter n=1 Tax=Albidovulum sp. TaxID=1872424 RepID=UPI001324BB5D|nr:DMT family transporter [Defluviimonas sp.]KAB2883422.1 MAG: DMT family transporter [Defluviimonas sp.]